jgi:hypothetical protein
MPARTGDDKKGEVDFGIFDEDDDDDVPSLIDRISVGDDDDDGDGDDLPIKPSPSNLLMMRALNLPLDDEDGLLGVDDHILDGDLEFLMSRWQSERPKSRKEGVSSKKKT